jgi:hypothetical protein
LGSVVASLNKASGVFAFVAASFFKDSSKFYLCSSSSKSSSVAYIAISFGFYTSSGFISYSIFTI